MCVIHDLAYIQPSLPLSDEIEPKSEYSSPDVCCKNGLVGARVNIPYNMAPTWSLVLNHWDDFIPGVGNLNPAEIK